MDVLFAIYMMIAALSCANVGQAASVTKTFTPMTDSTILFNPERGFYKALNLFTSTDFVPSLSISDVQSMIPNDQKNSSIALVEIFLDNFITSNISSNVLEKLTNVVFPAIRSLSMKCLVRFAYTDAIIKVNDVVGVQDAAETQVVKHIQQLAPILQSNSDVIFVLQAGFVGAYGEWFFTNNFASPVDPEVVSTAQQAARNRIIAALLNAVPSNKMIQLRTPSYKQIYCNTVANLKSEEAFSSSIPCARIGIHNDCFLAPSGDQGTFSTDADRVWLTNEALYVMTGGESCMLNGNETSCAGGIAQVKAQRFTYLNNDYHDDVITGWINNGCYNTIANMLGYRFQLVSGTFPTSVTRGMNYQATVSVSNTGVAPLYNARSVQVILRNRATRALSVFPQSAIDLRRWAPGSIASVPLSFLVPLSLISGNYDVILNLPDASTSLANQPAARILFANGGDVQEADTRYNILGQVIVV